MRHVIQNEEGKFLVDDPVYVRWDANVGIAYVCGTEQEAEDLTLWHLGKGTSCRAVPLRDVVTEHLLAIAKDVA